MRGARAGLEQITGAGNNRRLETMRLGLVDVVRLGETRQGNDRGLPRQARDQFRAAGSRTIGRGRGGFSRVEHPLRLLNRRAAQGAHCIGARAENRIHTAGAQTLVSAGQEYVRACPLQADDAQHALLLLAQPQLQRLKLRLKRGRSCCIAGRRWWWCARRWRRRRRCCCRSRHRRRRRRRWQWQWCVLH